MNEGIGGWRRVSCALPALVFGAAFVWFARIQWATPNLLCDDSYFHVKMAQLIRASGPLPSFSWTPESLWGDSWADSSFMFHVLLIPFQVAFGPIQGAKWATVFLGAVAALLLFLVARQIGCGSPALLTALAFCGSSSFDGRLILTRGYLLALPLTLTLVGALVLERAYLVALVAFLFPLSYTAFHLVIAVAAIHALSTRLIEGRWPARTVVAALVGLALGLAAHPNFPAILRMWWVQNIWVMALRWTGVLDLRFGVELLDVTGARLLSECPVLPIGLLACGLGLLLRSRRTESRDVSVSTVAGLFCALSAVSFRFQEYAVPLVLLAAGRLLARPAAEPAEGATPAAASALRRHTRTLAVALAVAALGAWTCRREVAGASLRRGGDLAPHAHWLAAHSPRGSLVIADWDVFAQFFFWNDHNRMLVGLDPTFLVYRAPKTHVIFETLMRGVGDPHRLVHRLGGRYVLVKRSQRRLLDQLRGDSRFKIRVDRTAAMLFELVEPEAKRAPSAGPDRTGRSEARGP